MHEPIFFMNSKSEFLPFPFISHHGLLIEYYYCSEIASFTTLNMFTFYIVALLPLLVYLVLNIVHSLVLDPAETVAVDLFCIGP